MGIWKGLVLTICFIPILARSPLATVRAFSVAGSGATALSTSRWVYLGRSRIPGQDRRQLRQSASTDQDQQIIRSKRTVMAGATRARAIAEEARRRSREARRQTRVRGDENGTTKNRARSQRRAPGQGADMMTAESGEDGSAASITATAAIRRETNNEKTRRVREILDAYLLKAPPAAQWPPSRRMRVRGVDIHYKDTGRRGAKRGGRTDRPTLVMLHGLAGSTASWDEVIDDLADYGRVISFDRPGFGKTERVMPPGGLPWRLCPQTMGENPYSAAFAAKVLFGILDRLGVDKVILVAHSLGAQVALRAARTRPDMVRAMVLVAPAVLNPLDAKFVMGRDPSASLFSPITKLRTRVEMTAKLAAFNLQLLQPGEAPLETVRNITLNGDVEEKVQRNFHDPSIPDTRPELISKYVEPLTDPLWDRGLLHFYKSLQGEVQPGEQLLSSTLEVWKGPSMIVTGDNDPTVPTQSSVYVAEEMEGRLVVMESCAHIPMDEKPEVFTSAVLSFADSDDVRDAWGADDERAKAKKARR